MKIIKLGARYPFTKRVRYKTESPTEMSEILERLASERPKSELDLLEQWCRDIHESYGLPTDDRIFIVETDNDEPLGFRWLDVPENKKDMLGMRFYCGARALASGNNPPVEIDSTVGYACRILDRVLSAREEAEKGNVFAALDEALIAGRLASEMNIAEWYGDTRRHAADKANARYNGAREVCIETARTVWGADSDCEYMKADVIRLCREELQRQELAEPADATLWGWLKDAGIVPDYASARGRRPNE